MLLSTQDLPNPVEQTRRFMSAERLNGPMRVLVGFLWGIPQAAVSLIPCLACRGLSETDWRLAASTIFGGLAAASCAGAALYRGLRSEPDPERRRILCLDTRGSLPLSVTGGIATFLGQYTVFRKLDYTDALSLSVAGVSAVAITCLLYAALSDCFARRDLGQENRFTNALLGKGRVLIGGLLGSTYLFGLKNLQLSHMGIATLAVSIFTAGLGFFAPQQVQQPREVQIVYV